MKKRHLRIAIAALLVLACVGALLGFAACDPEKEAASITAELKQEYVYDGQEHKVEATLSHDETELVYSPQQGYTEVGTYTIEVSAPATEHYLAPAPVVVQLVILDPSKVAAEELAEKFTTVSNFDVSKPIGVDLGVDLSYTSADKSESWAYTLSVKGTLALNAPDSTAFTIGLKDKAGVNNFDLTYDGKNDDIYVKFGKSGEEKMYKAGNADLLGALVSGVDSTTVTMNTYLSMLIGALGTNCVNNGDNTFTMDFDLKQTLGGPLGSLVDMILPQIEGAQDILNTVYALFGASDWNGFVAALPDVKGKMDVKFSDSAFLGISLRDVSYTNGDSKGTIQASVQPFSISNTEVKVTLPSQEEAQKYIDTNLLNINAKGVLSLKSGDKSYVDYNVELMADLDILSLVSGNTDENTGKLYLRIFHICDENCGAYCKSKIEAGEGSILEVAYDSSISASNVYIVAGVRNLITFDFVNSMLKGTPYEGIVTILNVGDILPEYTAITADINGLFAKAVAFPAEGEGSGSGEGSGNEGGTNILSTIAKVLGNLDFSVGNGKVAELDIDLSGLLTGLGADASLVSTLGGIFGDPDKGNAMGGLSLTIDSVGVFDTDFDGYFSEHDMMETLTKVKDAKVESEKNFSTGGIFGQGVNPGLGESAKTWEIVNLSDSNVPDMYTDLDLSALSVYEAQTQLIGNEVYFNVTTLDDSQRTKVAAKIYGIAGIDWNKLGVEQNVELLVSVPQTILSNTVTGALAATVDVYSLFKTTVPVKITLAAVSDVKFTSTEAFENGVASYELGDVVAKGFADVTVTYKKTVGDKTMEASTTLTYDTSKYVWECNGDSSRYVTVNGVKLEKGNNVAINPCDIELTYSAFGETYTQRLKIVDQYAGMKKELTLSANETTVNKTGFKPTLTFTFGEGETAETIEMTMSSKYALSNFVSYSDGVEVEIPSSATYIKFTTFPGDDPTTQTQCTVQMFFDMFGEHFAKDITLKNTSSTYSATVESVSNGMTAEVTVTITNAFLGLGSGYENCTITLTDKLFPDRTEVSVSALEYSVNEFAIANDLTDAPVTIKFTITSTQAGTGLYNLAVKSGSTSIATGSLSVVFSN